MVTRTLGLLATVGGAGATIGAGVFVGLTMSASGARPWSVVVDPLAASIMSLAGTGGMVALAMATAGLVFRFQDRISGAGAMAGSIGSAGGILGLLGSFRCCPCIRPARRFSSGTSHAPKC